LPPRPQAAARSARSSNSRSPARAKEVNSQNEQKPHRGQHETDSTWRQATLGPPVHVLDLKADLYFGEPQLITEQPSTFGAPGTSVGTVPSYSPETSWTGFGPFSPVNTTLNAPILAFLKIIFYEERDSPLLPRKKDLPALVLQGRQRSGSQAVELQTKGKQRGRRRPWIRETRSDGEVINSARVFKAVRLPQQNQKHARRVPAFCCQS